MKNGIVIVRVLFCGEIVVARAFMGMAKAREWARKIEGIGDAEPDGPQFEVEYSV